MSALEKLLVRSAGEGTFKQVAGEPGIFSFSSLVREVDFWLSAEGSFALEISNFCPRCWNRKVPISTGFNQPGPSGKVQ